MFKVKNRDTRTKPLAYFTACSSVSTVNFKQANADWEPISKSLKVDLEGSARKCQVNLRYICDHYRWS